MKGFSSIVLLLMANVFMTTAWYLHLKFKHWKSFETWGLPAIILFSWGIAFFEYCLQVPANRIGSDQYGGPFSLMQLKIIQEVITLSVFVLFTLLFFKEETLKWNHIVSGLFLVGAVYFAFRK